MPPEPRVFAEYTYKSSLEPREVPLCSLPSDVPMWLRYELASIGASCSEQQLLAGIARLESRFNPTAKNPASSASGLLQFLESTWTAHGCGNNIWSSNQQLRCGLKDIRRGLLKQWAVWPQL